MKASQYIYTSWKNAPNFGFSVYSTSGDIDRADMDVIALMMKYRAPAGMPYEPTEEEIDRLFPRIFAYFKLPSGKYCMAQSAYVGHEYKGFEEQGRMGNYIIHAYVFNANALIKPSTFMLSDKFRRDLTLEEWRATNPPPLPHTEVEDACKISDSRLVSFLAASGRKDLLKSLVQAVIESVNSGKPVYLNDAPENIPMWYNAITLSLPTDIASKMTMVVNTSEDKQSNPMIPVDCKPLLTTVYHDKFTVFDYRQKMLSGAYVFDLRGGNISQIQISKYVDNVVEMLCVNVFDAFEYADKISQITADTGLDADRASNVFLLLQRRYDFDATDDFISAYEDASKYAAFNIQTFANDFCALVLQNKYPRDERVTALLKSVYPNLSGQNKAALIKFYFDSYSGSGDPVAFATGFKNNIPFPFGDFIVLYFKDYYNIYSNDICKIYLMFDGILENQAIMTQKFGQAAAKEFLTAVIEKYALGNDDRAVKIFLNCLSEKNVDVVGFAQVVLLAITKGGYRTLDTNRFFDYLKLTVSQPQVAAYHMGNFIQGLGGNEDCIRLYQAFLANNPSFATVDKILRADNNYARFFVELEKYVLLNSNMGEPELLRYYTEYYLNGLDKENLFIKQLEKFFLKLPKESRPPKAAALYSQLFYARQPDIRQPNVRQPDLRIMEILCRFAFGECSVREIEKSLSDNSINQNYGSLAENAKFYGGALTSYLGGYEVAKFARKLPVDRYNPKPKDRNKTFSQNAYEKLAEMAERSSLSAGLYSEISAPYLLELFAKNYSDRVLLLADGFIRMSKMSFKAIEYVIQPLLNVNCFDAYLIGALKDSKIDVISFISAMIRYCVLSVKDNSVNKFVTKILEQIDKGTRKKAFNAALNDCGDKQEDKVRQFIDCYNLNHKRGLFGGLFGRKK